MLGPKLDCLAQMSKTIYLLQEVLHGQIGGEGLLLHFLPFVTLILHPDCYIPVILALNT